MDATDYKVIAAMTAWGLAKDVKKHLSQGWKLQGGAGRSFNGFAQALIK